MATKGIRKSVNLSGADERDLAPFLAENSEERDELASMTGERDVAVSESAALIALARLGARAVRDRILERGYAEWAAAEDHEGRAFAADAAQRAEATWRAP